MWCGLEGRQRCLFWKSCMWYQSLQVTHTLISAAQMVHHWAWVRRILQKGSPSGTRRRFVVVSGVTFLIVPNLVAIYESYAKSQPE